MSSPTTRATGASMRSVSGPKTGSEEMFWPLTSVTSEASSGGKGFSSMVRLTLETAGSSSSGYSRSKSSVRSRGSAIVPVSAAAAAVSGEHR